LLASWLSKFLEITKVILTLSETWLSLTIASIIRVDLNPPSTIRPDHHRIMVESFVDHRPPVNELMPDT
jgi:hypothetical protein